MITLPIPEHGKDKAGLHIGECRLVSVEQDLRASTYSPLSSFYLAITKLRHLLTVVPRRDRPWREKADSA